MHSKVFLSLALMILLFAGCTFPSFMGPGCYQPGIRGNGILQEESREITPFSRLEINGAFEVDVAKGDQTALAITADDNLLPLIETENRGSRLVIDCLKDISPTEAVRIRITCSDLEEVVSNGASSVKVAGIEGASFKAEVNGAGFILLQGETKELEVALHGAGSVDAKNLEAKRAAVSISGAASATVHASDSLMANVSGVGNVEYYGNPQSVATQIQGVGSITRR